MQGQIAIIALILVSLLLARKFLVSRLKDAFLHRLPKPYLGDGPNMEWAMKKRVELEEGKLISEPSIYEPSEPLAWHLEEGGDEPRSKAHHDNLDASEDWYFQFEAPSGELDESLLRSWLGETSQINDLWAKRLLEDRDGSEER